MLDANLGLLLYGDVSLMPNSVSIAAYPVGWLTGRGMVPGSKACPLCMHVVLRSTLASGTFFCGKFFPFMLIQEEQVVSY